MKNIKKTFISCSSLFEQSLNVKSLLCIFLLLLFKPVTLNAKDYILLSPDKQNKLIIRVNKSITWSLMRNSQMLIQPSEISMTISNHNKLGQNPIVTKTLSKSVNQVITAIVPVRNKIISDTYSELKLMMKEGYALEFRAYNIGVAYRFVTELGNQQIDIEEEEVNFNFNDNDLIYLPKEKDPEFQGHYEALFQKIKLSDVSSKTYGFLPLYISSSEGTKMVITESNLNDYPNLFLFGSSKYSLKGQFPKFPIELKNTGNIHLDEIIAKKAPYIARTNGSRAFPWRVVIISPDDKGLLENDLVYQLASPNVLKDNEWIKPGKVAWDWWNNNNIYGVNFKSGINTATYKYFIDFAAEFDLQYIMVDEGWQASPTDFLHATAELDIKEVIKYAKSKNVGVLLWTLWKPLNENLEKTLDEYVKWGIKGIKVDFMARADQSMVNFYRRTAKAAADRHLLVDFHGAFKPVGLNREYPNVLNYEGVKGLEQSKWDTIITPVHNTILPFTRMVAGPMDYTPGAMLNANKGEFSMNWTSPMSMGTRAQQASMYVIYNAPLQMLSDNPSNYKREPAYTHFISRIPTTWDKTVALHGKIGEYVVVAKKNGNKWYIGGMTNWDSRSFELSLTFLDSKKYKIEILQDGINAEKHAADYKITSSNLKKGDTLSITMAPGGGYVAILTPLE